MKRRTGLGMVDTVDKSTRSRMMALVPRKDTKPEMALRRALHARGLRYRVHVQTLDGTPDIAFKRFRAVCFVHGCFWHRHAGCRGATDPDTRREYWQEKFRGNIRRDSRNTQVLLEKGWRVGTIWECALRSDLTERTAEVVEMWLRGTESTFETPLVLSDHGD